MVKIIEPKRRELAKAEGEVAEKMAALKVKEDELAEVMANLKGLQDERAATMKKKEDLKNEVELCATRLQMAEMLINGLGGEKTRWSQNVVDLTTQYDNIVGDILISSGVVAYLGVFTASYRLAAVQGWAEKLLSRDIACSKSFSLEAALGSAVEIREWCINKLPSDSFSIDNAIMLKESNRFPLMIDPQGQANNWVRNTEGKNGLSVVKQSQSTFVRTIGIALRMGKPVLLENVPEKIDPILDTLLQKKFVKMGGNVTVQLGEEFVEYDEKFNMYITTKLRSPHYSPETCVMVNMLNFMATPEGLEDQMLGITVKQEMPELEIKREALVIADAENKRQLKEIEDEILRLLAAAEGNILDNKELVDKLNSSKVKGEEIQKQVDAAAKTQVEIDEARAGYKPVAFRVALLFFCIADLSLVDPMYQYSLEWYVKLFLRAIEKATATSDLEVRLKSLCDTFTEILYVNVCRSLFEAHKMLFSFMLCSSIAKGDKRLSDAYFRFLLQGNTAVELEKPNPCAEDSGDGMWMSQKSWGDVLALSKLPGFEDFDEEVSNRLHFFYKVYMAVDPVEELKEFSEGRYDTFQTIMVMRCFRGDKLVEMIQGYIGVEMGKRFIDPPPFDLMVAYEDSVAESPLLFVLTPGADPMTELLKIAKPLGYTPENGKLASVSLGQGQGPIAANAIEMAVDKGFWVCLQNVHLSESWMPELERICESITPETCHDNFRLWLTSMPHPKFPVYILQNGVKVTLEPPKGIRNNLKGRWLSLDKEFVEDHPRAKEFSKLLFGM